MTIKYLIGDSETDGLEPTKVHCFSFKTYPEGKKYSFREGECYSEELLQLLDSAEYIVGHNFIGYDYPKVFKKLLKVKFDDRKIIDTLILSRMHQFDRVGGHGLESWGEQLGVSKPKHEDWSQFSEEMMVRCQEDVEINWRVFNKFFKEMGEEQILGLGSKIEHRAQVNLDRMKNYGFWFNLPLADSIYAEVSAEEERLKSQLQKDFPPRAKPRRPNKPVSTVYEALERTKVLDANGNPVKKAKGAGYVWDERMVKKTKDRIPGLSMDQVFGDFTAIEWEPFNPGSPDQILEKLDSCGWKPVVFNKPSASMQLRGLRVGSPKVSDEENLETIPEDAPESIKNIGHYLIVRGRRSRMQEWFSALDPATQRIHGTILGLGARTHRSAHRDPNQANVPGIYNRRGELAYMGREYRSCWGVPPLKEVVKYKYLYKTPDERVQIGVDAEGIQLRILCHYLDDPEYTKQVLSGDIHTYNMFAAGINPGTCKVDEELVRKKFGRPISPAEAVELRLGKTDGFDWSGRSVAKTFNQNQVSINLFNSVEAQ